MILEIFSVLVLRALHGGLKIWILSSRGENNILLFRKICFHHSKVESISSRHRVIFSIYYTSAINLLKWHYNGKTNILYLFPFERSLYRS